MDEEPNGKGPVETLDLGKLIGARQAFGVMAGHCSAAHATLLRDIRDSKRYLAVSETFEEFCTKYLHVTRRTVDRTIALLNELGPGYFGLAQLTGISAEEFRALAPAVRDNCLEYGGEAIALVEENAARLAEAVEELRRSAPEKPRIFRRRKSLQRMWERVAGELREAAQKCPLADEGDFEYLLTLIRADLSDLEADWKAACTKRRVAPPPSHLDLALGRIEVRKKAL